jgi:Peptidase A4 family
MTAPDLLERKIKTGFVVTTFPAPRPHVNLSEASAQALARAGIPPRPDHKVAPLLHAQWLKAWGSRQLMIEPSFRDALKIRRRSPTIRDGLGDNDRWSGVVAFAHDPSRLKRGAVTGSWVVPSVHYDPATHNENRCSIWIGIDGYNTYSTNLLQAGIECIAEPSGATSYYAWWEWVGGGADTDEQPIPLDISPGDTIDLQIWVTSDNTANISMSSSSRPGTVAVAVKGPSGAAMLGGCAEWIVEAPTVDGNLAHLPRFDPITISSAMAWDGNQTTLFAGSGTPLNLISDAPPHAILASGHIVSHEIVTCTRT